jgi:phosphomannomutase
MTLAPIFKAYDVRATYPDKLNEEAAWKIGVAVGRFLSKHAEDAGNEAGQDADTVLVSRDMRPHSESLAKALIEGIRASGMNVIDLGMCDTSFQYFAINFLGAAGGVQTTASHNPINYNGFKISRAQARPIGASTGLKEIQAIAETVGPRGSLPLKGKVQERDIWGEYREHVMKFLEVPNRALKVFCDASNGMAGKMVPKVFTGINNLELIPLNFEIGGKFAHEPNPLVAANMAPTQEGVRKHKADLGVCFDGDADRCILTDEKGEIIGCDHLTALLADYFLKQSPGSTIVYDLRSSKAVEETVRKLGGQPRRGRVGHVFMKAELRQTGGVFGGELSGHFYFRDNFFADSGAITFACVASILGQTSKPLSELIAPYKKYPQSGEINFRAEDKAGVMEALKKKYPGAKVDELDGVTIDLWDAPSGGGFWFNVRASNTEPLLRLNAEAKDKAKLEKLLSGIKPMMGTEDHGH